MALFVVGDVHGMFHELEEMVHKIKFKISTLGIKQATVVFVGDYCDRGRFSKQVFEYVKDLVAKGDKEGLITEVRALMGNHERMMIDVADDLCYGWADTWMLNGGIQTLQSYSEDASEWKDLKKLVGYSMINWIRMLPKSTIVGEVAISHAGIDNPNMLAAHHSEQELLWSRQMRTGPHKFHKFTVHGHTPMKNVKISDYAAYIDTGCVFGNKLTTLFIPDENNPVRAEMELIEVKTHGN